MGAFFPFPWTFNTCACGQQWLLSQLAEMHAGKWSSEVGSFPWRTSKFVGPLQTVSTNRKFALSGAVKGGLGCVPFPRAADCVTVFDHSVLVPSWRQKLNILWSRHAERVRYLFVIIWRVPSVTPLANICVSLGHWTAINLEAISNTTARLLGDLKDWDQALTKVHQMTGIRVSNYCAESALSLAATTEVKTTSESVRTKTQDKDLLDQLEAQWFWLHYKTYIPEVH